MPSPSTVRTRLSVVIPTHDTVGLTLQCLESLPSRIGELPVQTLVVDDASEDGTAEAVAERFPEVCVLRQASRAGFSASVNRGLTEAEGDLLVALNSDTVLQPGSLEAVLARFAENQRLGVAGARLFYPDGTPQWSGGPEPGLLFLFGLASGLPALLARLPGWRRLRPVAGTGDSPRVDWVTGAALALRRAVWQEVGPFETSYRFYGQDLDLCLRARSAGWEVEVIPGFRVIHHHGATIGRGPRAVARQDPLLLWTDLIRWAARHRGDAWAKRAVLALRLGGRLRLLGRRLRELALPPRSRAVWRRDSLAYRRALAALSRATAAQDQR